MVPPARQKNALIFEPAKLSVKSPIFGLKRRILHQNLSTFNFQTIWIGLEMARCTYIDIYIDTYIRILYDQNTVKSPIFCLKRRILHQNSSTFHFQTIWISLEMVRCTYIDIYIDTYIRILYDQNTAKSPIFGVKRRILHQNSSTFNFQTVWVGLEMVRCTYIDIYIDTYIPYSLWSK